jgi:hypothetical protein
MGCCFSQNEDLSEYASKLEELKKKYYSNLPNIEPSNILIADCETRINDFGKDKIVQNKSKRKYNKSKAV